MKSVLIKLLSHKSGQGITTENTKGKYSDLFYYSNFVVFPEAGLCLCATPGTYAPLL